MIRKLIAIAVAAVLVTATPAQALPKCTSSQTAAINSQKSVVAGYQQSFANDTKKNNDAVTALQKATAKATELNAKIVASQQKIAGLLANVAKNLKSSPSIARGYQAQADSEQKVLSSTQSSYTWAAKDVVDATKVATSAAATLDRTKSNLDFQQKKLDQLKAVCS